MTPEEHREAFRSGWNAAIEQAAKLLDAKRTAAGAGYVLIEAAREVRALRESSPSQSTQLK